MYQKIHRIGNVLQIPVYAALLRICINFEDFLRKTEVKLGDQIYHNAASWKLTWFMFERIFYTCWIKLFQLKYGQTVDSVKIQVWFQRQEKFTSNFAFINGRKK